ncbi:hypothetical protein [Microbacterium sp. Bi128]|uniref:hypothetical protein n=1 Tax=Microbacterium sp. Bi128 TaxID=2821115 RepID=UPI001D4936A2|nr:hypothetical protein [Microbacterium sp. Bi128]CAH0144745.1 hypothetical protein SRABI128_00388 [Microbacterium sp. Bi128]
MGERDDAEGTTGGFNGINPDFDVEAHRGEPIYIGKNLADARFVGYVGGSPRKPAEEDSESGSTS